MVLVGLEWPPVAAKPLRLLGVADGRSINVARWARRLVERGHEVFLVSDRIPPGRRRPTACPVHDVRIAREADALPVVRRARIGPAIGALARQLDVDLVHAHYLLPYGYWAARARRHPLVVSPWSRDVFVDANERRQGRKRAVEAIAASDYLVVNSEANRLASIDLGADPARIREIIWYSELDRFAPDRADPELRARLGWPDDALVVLSLRNYRPYTNLDVVLRAFARGRASEPRARLAPRRPGRPDATASSRRSSTSSGSGRSSPSNGSSGRTCRGSRPQRDVAVTIAGSDSTPASLLEVMASRVPVVAGRTWSIDEWIGPDEGGALVECRDEDAVAAALRQLLPIPSSAVGTASGTSGSCASGSAIPASSSRSSTAAPGRGRRLRTSCGSAAGTVTNPSARAASLRRRSKQAKRMPSSEPAATTRAEARWMASAPRRGCWCVSRPAAMRSLSSSSTTITPVQNESSS